MSRFAQVDVPDSRLESVGPLFITEELIIDLTHCSSLSPEKERSQTISKSSDSLLAALVLFFGECGLGALQAVRRIL